MWKNFHKNMKSAFYGKTIEIVSDGKGLDFNPISY